MDRTAHPEAQPAETPASPRYNAEHWDATLKDQVSFDSPGHNARNFNPSNDVAASFGWPLPTSSTCNTDQGIFDQWFVVPNQWDAIAQQDVNHVESVPPSRKASDANMQDQIDELRRTISVMINDQQHNQPSAYGSYPSTGYASPADPFDFSDDSPIYSRRTSAPDIVPIPAKRGQRVPGGYACDKCDSRFDVPSQLKHHERKHVPKDGRPHACAECGDRFLYPKDVTRHVRQKHSTTRIEHGLGIEGSSLTPDKRGDGTVGHRRRRDRRSTYIRHLEASVRQKNGLISELHSRSATPLPEDRRDSASADVAAESTDKFQGATHLIDSKQRQLLHDLLTTFERQQQTIAHLQQEIQRATDNATTWQIERDAFAEFFQHMSATFDFHSPHQLTSVADTTVLKHQAKGWLSAIEMLIGSSSTQNDTQKLQTRLALQHIGSTLDELDENAGFG